MRSRADLIPTEPPLSQRLFYAYLPFTLALNALTMALRPMTEAGKIVPVFCQLGFSGLVLAILNAERLMCRLIQGRDIACSSGVQALYPRLRITKRTLTEQLCPPSCLMVGLTSRGFWLIV